MAQEAQRVDGTQDSSNGEGSYLQIEDLQKKFGDIIAVNNIDISLEGNELITIVGPSGCGKTTTLRMIAGLESPTNGKITIDGRDITYDKPKDRDLAFVFQNTAIFPHLSVRENIRFGLDHKTSLSKGEKNQRVEDAADLLGIGEMVDRDPTELSGGQQQRVSIGRAMVIEPSAFLLDEPFASLDANLRDRMQTEIKKLQRDLETLLIFVTHDQEEAMTLGDRIVVMNDGSVQQVGKPNAIYNDPGNLFVAEFIGSPSTNIFQCEIRKSGAQTLVVNELFSYDFSDSLADSSVNDGDLVSLAIRPEYISLADNEGDFTAEIDIVEPQGERATVRLSNSVRELTATVDQRRDISSNDVLGVSFDLEETWLFDQDGNRLV